MKTKPQTPTRQVAQKPVNKGSDQYHKLRHLQSQLKSCSLIFASDSPNISTRRPRPKEPFYERKSRSQFARRAPTRNTRSPNQKQHLQPAQSSLASDCKIPGLEKPLTSPPLQLYLTARNFIKELRVFLPLLQSPDHPCRPSLLQ